VKPSDTTISQEATSEEEEGDSTNRDTNACLPQSRNRRYRSKDG